MTEIVSVPTSNQAMLNKLNAETPSEALPVMNSEESDMLGGTVDSAAVIDPAVQSTEVVPEKTESKSAKAARESRELRAARKQSADLKSQLEKVKASQGQAEQFTKIQEMFESNPKEAIKLLGKDPLTAYQKLTDQWLSQDPDMKEKDPIQEKLKQLDPYVESLKKKEAEYEEQKNQQNIASMITQNVNPVIESKKEQLECLFDYFNPDGKANAEQVKQAVARNIFDNADWYFANKLGNDHKKLVAEFGNYQTYFTKVAEHLEKQLEQQLDQTVQRAAKLNKFKSRFQLQQEAKKESINNATDDSGALPVLDPNSTQEFTLDQVISNSSKANNNAVFRSADHSKRAEIDALLAKNGLKV